MLLVDPHAHAREHARRLQAEAAAERLLPRSRARTRNLLAASLRRAADRLDPVAPPAAPLQAQPARRPC